MKKQWSYATVFNTVVFFADWYVNYRRNWWQSSFANATILSLTVNLAKNLPNPCYNRVLEGFLVG